MLASISSGGTATIRHETEYVKSGFTQESQSTTLPNTNLPTNILWGAACAGYFAHPPGKRGLSCYFTLLS
jgi:hypothetical protein